MIFKPFDYNDEVWRIITSDIVPNIQENKYIASNYGYISNIDYNIHHMVYSPKYCGQFNNRAYINLLDSNGNGLLCIISRIVAKLFCPGYANDLEVNHIDGNPRNNYYKNLEWCTRSENIRHAYDNDLMHTSLNEDVVNNICKLLEEDKLSAEEIANKLGLYSLSSNPIAIISAIKKSKLWTHISKNYNIPLGRHGRLFNDNEINIICKLIEENPDIDTKSILDYLHIEYDKDSLCKYRNTISAIKHKRKYLYISKNYSF